MKIIEVLGTAVLLLLPGAIVSAYAQEQHEQEKQPQQKQQQAKPTQHQQQAKPAQQQAKPAQQQQRAQNQQPAKPAQQQAKPAPQQQRAQSQQPAKPAQQQQLASGAQPAANHGRIPDDRFRASFGRAHTFHVNRAEFAGASPRFQYGGFWFALVDPWPAAWLYTDDVYVDYMNGGYFLCDPVHPGVYLSINVG